MPEQELGASRLLILCFYLVKEDLVIQKNLNFWLPYPHSFNVKVLIQAYKLTVFALTAGVHCSCRRMLCSRQSTVSHDTIARSWPDCHLHMK